MLLKTIAAYFDAFIFQSAYYIYKCLDNQKGEAIYLVQYTTAWMFSPKTILIHVQLFIVIKLVKH